MFIIRATQKFDRRMQKIKAKDQKLYRRIVETIKLLQQNPRHPQLETHKAEGPLLGRVFSSKVTQDIRIRWDYDKEKGATVILLLTVGGHSGKYKIYK